MGMVVDMSVEMKEVKQASMMMVLIKRNYERKFYEISNSYYVRLTDWYKKEKQRA